MKAFALTLAASIVALSVEARAADPPKPFTDSESLKDAPPPPTRARTPADDLAAFVYVRPISKHYVRATTQLFGILGAGLVDYLLNTQARGGALHPGDQRWDLRYDWPTFRSKLTGENYHLDTNRFNTNYISHPFAGTAYYTTARASHLSILESFGFATLGAFIWEYFGELREEVSVNDVIVTPVAGITIGETLMQHASFFKRGRKSFANDFFAAFASPAKVLNDWAESSDPLRSEDVDELGFTRDVWHRFELFAGGGVTRQRSSAPGGATTTYTDFRIGLDTRLANLPGYGRAAKRSDLFDDGNTSQLHFEMTLSRGQLADAVFTTQFMPAGYYWRSAAQAADGGLRGAGAIVGLRANFEYGVHDYDRDRARPMDIVTILSPFGMTAEYTHDFGRGHLRARVDVGAELAGVQSYALSEYRKSRPDTNLQTVLVQQGYYHSWGITVVPQVELSYAGVELGGRLRLDSFRGIEGLDEQQATITQEIPLADRRVGLRAWGAYTLPRTRVRLAVDAQYRARFGDVGDVHTSQSERSLWGSIGLVL